MAEKQNQKSNVQPLKQPVTELRLPVADAQRLANYLVTRPWAEANPFVAILTNLKPIAPDEPSETPE